MSAPRPPHPSLVLALGLLSVALAPVNVVFFGPPLVIGSVSGGLAVLLGRRALSAIEAGELRSASRGPVRAGMVAGGVGCLLHLVYVLALGGVLVGLLGMLGYTVFQWG